MKHGFKTTLAAALLAGSAVAAHAEGVYVGGSLGTPDYRSSVNGISGDDGGTSGKVFGGYQLTPNFGVEAGYANLGHVDAGADSVKAHGTYVDAVGRYEFAPQWSVLGSAGVAHARLKTNLGNDSSPALKLGAGLEYAMNSQVALLGQYEHYHFTDAFGSKPNVGQYTLGVKVSF